MGTCELVTSLHLPGDAATAVEAYLSELECRLPLTARQRARIVAEVGDGLACTITSYVEAGMTPVQAARHATGEFGDPLELASQFTAVIASGTARRVGLGLLVTGPLIGLVWVAGAGDGAGWAARISSVLDVMPYFPLILAFTVPAAVVATVSGWLSLRYKASSRLATGAALLATLGCTAGDMTLIATTLAPVLQGGPALAGWVIAAAAFSGLRLTAAVTASGRLSRLRAAGC
jgi:hypothetical protein